MRQKECESFCQKQGRVSLEECSGIRSDVHKSPGVRGVRGVTETRDGLFWLQKWVQGECVSSFSRNSHGI